MQHGLLAIRFNLLRGDPSNGFRHIAEWLAGALRQYLDDAGALQIIHIVKGVGYRVTTDEHAVVRHKQHVGVDEFAANAIAFG